MADKPSWQHYRAKVAALSRSRTADDPELLEAEAQLKAARDEIDRDERTEDLIQFVTNAVNVEPYLTEDQLQRIASALFEAPKAQ